MPRFEEVQQKIKESLREFDRLSVQIDYDRRQLEEILQGLGFDVEHLCTAGEKIADKRAELEERMTELTEELETIYARFEENKRHPIPD